LPFAAALVPHLFPIGGQHHLDFISLSLFNLYTTHTAGKHSIMSKFGFGLFFLLRNEMMFITSTLYFKKRIVVAMSNFACETGWLLFYVDVFQKKAHQYSL